MENTEERFLFKKLLSLNKFDKIQKLKSFSINIVCSNFEDEELYAIEMEIETWKNKSAKKESMLISIEEFHEFASSITSNAKVIFENLEKYKEEFFNMIPVKQ